MNASDYLLKFGSGATINPLTLPNLAAWYDAADPATLFQDAFLTTPATLDSDPVGSWADKSGNARHVVQGTASRRLTLKLGVQNGRNVLRTDGVDDDLALAFTLAQPVFLAMVVNRLAAGAGSVRFVDGFGTGDTLAVYGVGGGTLGMYAGFVGPQVPNTIGTPVLLECLFNSTSSFMWGNGVQSAVGNPGTGLPGGIAIGARSSGTNGINGDIAEILLFTAQPSAGDQVRLRAYLKNKWGTP